MSRPDASDGPPPFEDAFAGDDVEQRIYGTILQTREPTTATAIADAAECDPKTAGIVTEYDGHPATYERNDAYFEWRRINELAAGHSVAELQNRVRELSSRISEYEEAYDAESPAAVDAVAAAEAGKARTIDDVYSDLADWATAREERERYERARQQRTGGEREQASG